MTLRLAKRMQELRPSAVREILKVAERPDVISLAGGLPAPELFPVGAIAAACADVLAEAPGAALQYGITEGYTPLREWIAASLREKGVPADVERLRITNGSQQGIDLVARLLLNPGDTVLVENPTYLAALQVFAAAEAKVVGVPGDDEGVDIARLEAAILAHKPALIYLVTEFQNPRGTSLSPARRRALAEVATRHQVPILEDDPYGALRFAGKPDKPMAAYAPDLTFHLGTFSKTLAPGLRIGWLFGPAEAMRPLTIAKQACDLHTATLAQRVAAKLLETFDYHGHLETIRAVYGERCQAMLRALETHMPEGTRWSRPEGGLFLWLELPKGLRDDEVFHAAIERQVAVVPGSGFFADGADHGFLRLNYSNQSIANIQEGVSRLGETIRTLLAAR